MKKLRVPRALVVVVASGAIAASAVASCGDDEPCIACLPDPRIGDAGTDGMAVECPPCLPKDGVCPVGCIPEGFV
jgi:hypothetical protein